MAQYGASDRLDSQKEISAYLKRAVRAVQRWENEEGLPIHHHPHNKFMILTAIGMERTEMISIRRRSVQKRLD
jgi:hypothetical protein